MATDRTPQCVKDVLDKPGIYEFRGRGYKWYFEVDGKKLVHQLNPRTMARDGVLSKSGWNPEAAYGTVHLYEGREK